MARAGGIFVCFNIWQNIKVCLFGVMHPLLGLDRFMTIIALQRFFYFLVYSIALIINRMKLYSNVVQLKHCSWAVPKKGLERKTTLANTNY